MKHCSTVYFADSPDAVFDNVDDSMKLRIMKACEALAARFHAQVRLWNF
jgi:hypothetical protein